MDIIHENNEILLKRNGNIIRMKRSPLDIVGTISNKLFGILDQDYAKQLSNTIDKINQNENHLLNLIQNQTSIIDSTENIIKKDRQFADKQFSIINDYLSKLQQALEDTTNLAREQEIAQGFNTLSIHTTLMMMRYQKIQAALIDIITDCHNGKINPLLLTPQQLREELTLIRENIPTTMTVPGRTDHDDLLQLYSLMTVETRVTSEHVIFKLHLPLLSKEIFQLFKLTPVPFKINDNFFRIKTSTRFLAVSLHRDYYYTMTEDEISKCITNNQGNYVCNKKHAIFHKTTGEAKCEVGMLNHNSVLAEECKLESTTPVNTWIQLHNPNNWIYVLLQKSVLHIVCGTQSQPQILQGSGLLRFKSNCVIKQDSVTISAHSRYHSKVDNSFSPSVPLNFSMIENHMHKQQQREAHRILLPRNNSQDIDDIKKAIHHLQSNQHIKKTTTPDTVHQYSISYTALVLALCLIIAYAAKDRISCRKIKDKDCTQPEPMPRKTNFRLKTKASKLKPTDFNRRENV